MIYPMEDIAIRVEPTGRMTIKNNSEHEISIRIYNNKSCVRFIMKPGEETREMWSDEYVLSMLPSESRERDVIHRNRARENGLTMWA